MKVFQIDGEALSFLVEGSKIKCDLECGFEGYPVKWQVGEACPRCPIGVLEQMNYRVELEAYGGNGACGCDSFGYEHEPKLKRHVPGEHQCKHISAAQLFWAKIQLKIIAAQMHEKHGHEEHRNL